MFLKNRTITNTIENKISYEIFFGKRPNIKNLKLYGSKVFTRTPESKRDSKWDRKSDFGILVGYENVGYRVLYKGRVTVATHIDIIKKEEILVDFHEEDESENELNKKIEKVNPKKVNSLKFEKEIKLSSNNNEFIECDEKVLTLGSINNNYCLYIFEDKNVTGGHFEQCLDGDDGGNGDDDVVEEEDENGDDVDIDGNDENGEDDHMNNDGENDGSEDGEADDSMDEDDDDVGNDPDWEI
ncbi:coiled-coil domain-containing protein 1-like [Phymastichus coffea]|uniref:coiled-coil domain-containing protein 1-like n=1 Tax=Phymastichus coffea TaxID=108790 RepID=UPI00273CC7EE|nr:coiled-coil domain-containing protein 1-like [Phymastichus coffea]